MEMEGESDGDGGQADDVAGAFTDTDEWHAKGEG